MIQIAAIEAGRRPQMAAPPANQKSLSDAGAVERRPAPPLETATETASARPCLFAVPPPQTVWPRVFPGL